MVWGDAIGKVSTGASSLPTVVVGAATVVVVGGAVVVVGCDVGLVVHAATAKIRLAAPTQRLSMALPTKETHDESFRECLPGSFDDVLMDADRTPSVLMVGCFDEHSDFGAG